MFSFDSKVRYSEVDRNCKMEIASIIDYFQDCCCFQSESLGVGVKYANETGCAWLLNSWQIVIPEFPTYLDEITISTWPYAFDRIYGYRNFTIKSKSGKMLAMANSNWIYVNLDTASLVKLTPQITDVYPIEPKLTEMSYEARKITIPTEFVAYAPCTVEAHQIDTNHHMNNAQYIKLAQNYLPEDFKIWQMRVEYKKQALLGDILIPRITLTEQQCTVALVNTDGKPYCIVEFSKRLT